MLKDRIVENYGLVGISASVDISYLVDDRVYVIAGKGDAPIQILNKDDYKIFMSVQKVDKSVNMLLRTMLVVAVHF